MFVVSIDARQIVNTTSTTREEEEEAIDLLCKVEYIHCTLFVNDFDIESVFVELDINLILLDLSLELIGVDIDAYFILFVTP